LVNVAEWPRGVGRGAVGRRRGWLELVLAAQDLLCWTRALLLDGTLAVAEPKTLRYRLLHVAAGAAPRPRPATPQGHAATVHTRYSPIQQADLTTHESRG
jgi:hypothetical protein